MRAFFLIWRAFLMVHLQCVEASLNQFELAVKSLGILFEECFVETIAGDGQLPTASCTC